MKTKFTSISLIIAGCLTLLSTVPARLRADTLTVTSTADSGAGTLRNALASAANGDTIDASGVTGTILLTSGELLVPSSVTILGPGPANLAVNGNAASRVFHISGAAVTIAGLTITNGRASGDSPGVVSPANEGGGIYTGPGTLTVSNCSLSGNLARVYGGGIYNNGASGSATLTLSTSTLSGNSATYDGGGIYNEGASGSATLTVSASTLSSNSASRFGGGIYNNGESSGTGAVQIVNSTLSSNSAQFGGSIYNDGTSSGKATLTVSASTLRGNSATNSGGGIYNDGALGISTLTVSASTLSNNSAIDGGGIYNYRATLTLSNSSLSGNPASDNGGGIYNHGSFGSATLMLSASTLSGNSASSSGGGIYNNGSSGTGAVQMVTSTLSGNSAQFGGGIYNDGRSSGKATLLVRASTLSGNSASSGNGSGIRNNGGGGSASVELGSTIHKAGAVGANIANLSGTVSSDGYNLASDDGAGFLTGTADQINTDALLGPLQDNGGPTFTHALLPGSPAIDKGKNLNGSATDQRGLPRTVDIPSIPNAVGSDGTDIGAVEFQAPLLSNPAVGAGQYGFTLTGEPFQPVVVEASTNLVSWTALATNTLGVSPLHFNDPGWTDFQQRFYRAKLLP